MKPVELILGAALLAMPATAWGAPPSVHDEPVATSPPPRRFALVVGSNHALDDSLDPLRFADDDAAQMAEVLTEAGVDVALVTTLDRDSQALFPRWVSASHRPDRAGVDAAATAVRAKIAAARAAGATDIELLVYYSGHGDVGPDGQGYLTLEDGKLKRRDLFVRIIGKAGADHNHVLIDACRSEQFVLTRGKAGAWKSDRSARDYGEAVGEYLDKNHLGHFPNTGVVLAHSADQQTHEWERYRGGIFTHQLVSGLRGGADLNGDGAIEYSELGAFVSAANHGVADPRARLSVVVRPPKLDQRYPLLRHDDVASTRALYFIVGDRHRYTIEDSRGVRVADVRRSGEFPGYVRLPEGDVFVAREMPTEPEGRQEFALPADVGGVVVAESLAYVPSQSAARGALDQAFRAGLFTTPFGPGYYSGFTVSHGLLAVAEPPWHEAVWQDVADVRSPTVPVIAVAEPEAKPVVKPEKKPAEEPDPIRWGAVSAAAIFSPFPAKDPVPLSPKRVHSDEFRPCLRSAARKACSPIRGIDLRWQLFRVGDAARYPRFQVWFRSGYQAGHTEFSPRAGAMTFADGEATALSYVAVPLQLGGQVYAFDRFPLRPYAGFGFGLDIIQVRYRRQGAEELVKKGALVVFGLHAGLEMRITSFATLFAEAHEQWTPRRRVDGVPDFSNTGLTFITGASVNFPLTRRDMARYRERRGKR